VKVDGFIHFLLLEIKYYNIAEILLLVYLILDEFFAITVLTFFFTTVNRIIHLFKLFWAINILL